MKKIFILFAFLAAVYSIGCSDKLDINQFNGLSGNNNTGDTVYIQLSPSWEGFNHPSDIIVGNEPFIYVADTDNDRIVMLNIAGQVVGTRAVKKPVALAQDYKLNLIVCAQFDTTLSTGETETFSAVYKYDLVAAGHHIENAPVTRLLPAVKDLNRPDRVYTGVTVFDDNSFYVSRTGPLNKSYIDPDNSILIFSSKSLITGLPGDTLIGRVANISAEGTGLVSAFDITSIRSLKKKGSRDIFLTLNGKGNNFKTQWLTYVETAEKSDYESRLEANASAFMTVNKFKKPMGTTLDSYGNIYVADAETDSVYKFNSMGEELQSFGGPKIFNAPNSVAWFDKTLYVVDKNNNRIARFVLSTELK